MLSCLSDQNVYLVKSEYESGGLRPDIALLDIRGKKLVCFNYLIELKYLKKSGTSKQDIEKTKQEASKQMHRYLQLDEFVQDSRIKGIIYIVVKDEIQHFEKIERA